MNWTKFKSLCGGAALFLALCHGSALAAQVPSATKPAITDMLLTARAPLSVSKSEVSRSILQVGEYLYVSGEPGLQTLHIDPATGKLNLTDDWPKSSHKMNAAAVKGDILYVANWSPGSGLALFSLKDPAHPKHLKSIKTRVHTWTADIHGDLLDVAVDDGTITGIETYDIHDPENPKLIHFLDIGDRLAGNVARHDSAAGKYMYFTHKKWLYVYDAADPAKPRRIRELVINGLAGKVLVRGDWLYMLARKDGPTQEGGLHVLSLSKTGGGAPDNPKPIAHWSQPEPRDMHFQGDRLVIPASGSGIYTLDVSKPGQPKEVAHWYLAWPDSGKHPGYAVCVTGDGKGDFVFLGTTSANDPDCRDDPSCPHRGGRVYSVKLPK